MSSRKIYDLDEFKFRKKESQVPYAVVPDADENGKLYSIYRLVISVALKKKWLLLAFFLIVAIFIMPTPEGLTESGKYALGLWLFIIICFVTEALPLPLTAVIVGSYQIITNMGNFQEVPKTFMDDAVIFIMGVLMMSNLLVKYNIHKKIAQYMLKLSGTRIERVVLGTVAFCAISAAFITEHATVTIMLPIGVGIVSLSGGVNKVPRLAKLIMLAITYGVIIGGPASPSGGARNALMISFLSNFGINISYGQWMLMAMPFTIIMIPVVTIWLLKLYKPEITDLEKVMETINDEMEADGPMTLQAKAAFAIFLAVLAGWVLFSQKFGAGNIAMIGIVLAAVLGLVDWSYLQKKTQWGVVVLYAGAISMGRMLITTGAASWLAKKLLAVASAFGVADGLPLLAVTTTITAITTNTMADGPTVAVLGPIFLKAAELSGTSLNATGVATSLGAAFSFLLVIATPANAIVYGSGFLKGVDFIKAGGLLFLISLLTLIALVWVWWHLLGIS
ncbi:MAG: DASS family sodium-coupled anion symporter [Peptococcaceae bacterium]|nr:DASS family sodium-coupled anion symporter [Peptococcaceae bacterium]